MYVISDKLFEEFRKSKACNLWACDYCELWTAKDKVEDEAIHIDIKNFAKLDKVIDLLKSEEGN